MTILHIRFPNQYELTSTFLRFQEVYESPNFRNKVFTHEEYFDWYAQECGNMTYFSDWHGFNLPDYAFDKFLRGDFDPLWNKEKELLSLIDDNFDSSRGLVVELQRPYYVIGTWRDNELAHEVIHGLYYTNKQYKEQVDLLIKHTDENIREPLERAILKHYDKSVLIDETNAYILTGAAVWMDREAYNAIDRLYPVMELAFMADFNNMKPTEENLQNLVTTVEW